MAISRRMRRVHLPGSFIILGLVILLAASPVAQADSSPSFIGSANSVSGVNNATPVTLPANGSPQQNSLATFNQTVNGFTISATDLKASTAVEGGTVRSDASLKNLKVTIGNNTITADAATAHAEATCANGLPTATGNGTVTGLVVNGVKNPSSPVDLPGFGTLQINFQRAGGSPTSNNLNVDALGFFTSASDVAPVLEIPFAGVGVSNCPKTPGVPPSGGGPLPPAGERPPWLLWGALLTTLGVFGLSGTLVVRRRWFR